MNMNNPYYYGTKLFDDKHIYVKRKADETLEQKIKDSELCIVFNARKQGKSTLLSHVTANLIQKDFIPLFYSFGTIDTSLQNIENLDEKIGKFYKEILEGLSQHLPDQELKESSKQWLNQYEDCKFNIKEWQQFLLFLVSKIQKNQKLVIVMDEIDSVKNLPFSTDDLFSTIRELYQDERYKLQLIFCLLGTIVVSDLIKDKTRTPFNVGTPINLNLFSFEESKQTLITSILKQRVEDAEETLKIILRETNGQPFLTQKILYKIVDDQDMFISKGKEESVILSLIERHITSDYGDADNKTYFTYSEERICPINENAILKYPNKTYLLLEKYKEILVNPQGIPWLPVDNEKQELRLAGLVIEERGMLIPTSPIHRHIFNESWIEKWLLRIIPNWYVEKKLGWENTGQDKYYLLNGQELKVVQTNSYWTSNDNSKFFNFSDCVYNEHKTKISANSNFINIQDQYVELIIDRIIYWTNHDNLFEFILNTIFNSDEICRISESSLVDNSWLDSLIQNHIIDNWQNVEILKEKHDKLSEDNKRFDLLVKYGQIRFSKSVDFSEDDELQGLLLETGLVKKRYTKYGYKLEVTNPIYENIFNESYIEEQLPNTRGYGKKLGMWLITQDEQYLLSAEELESNIVSLNDQELSEDENLFLLKSQLNILNKV